MTADETPGASARLLPQAVLVRALDGAPQGMVIADATHRIIFVNAAFTTLTGYAEADLMGQNCRMLQGSGSDPETLALMRSSLAEGRPFCGEILNYRKDGTPFSNALRISPVSGDDGAISHFISVHSDANQHAAAPDTAHCAVVDPSRPAPAGASPESPNYRARLRNGGLRMHMQPVVDLRTGATHFVEALARLELEDGTLVLPGEFLPLLDDADVALMFRQALDQVLGQLAEWDRCGLQLDVSINLAPSTLSEPECARWVAAGLSRHAISPERLGIELLENKVLHDRVQLDTFAALRALGVGLAMDDLGAGYSGLSRLLKLPFKSVKVDVGIVAHMRNRPITTLAMLTTLIQMGRDQDWDIIIEGLEDAALTEVAVLLGAPFGQGFYFCRPVPAPQIPEWLALSSRVPDRHAVRTPLGALAYHWLFHRTQSQHPIAHETCPITNLLLEQEDQMPVAWHRQLHQAVSGHSEASAALLGWLVEWSQADA